MTVQIPDRPKLDNPAPGLWPGWPRLQWDTFNAPGRSGYNPGYQQPGDPVGHRGVDLGADEGSDELAADDGRVHHLITPANNPQAGWGLETVRQVTGGWWGLRYLHNPAPPAGVLVSVGELVTRGQLIGQVGSTGSANYPHIHFEVRWLTTLRAGSLVTQGIPLDPLTFRLLTSVEPVPWPALLRPGDRHPCVPMLRGLLYGCGYLPTAGGGDLYGTRPEAAVKQLQADHRLEVDGLVGPATRRALTTATGQALGVTR
jgi:hypothetical protein